MESSPEELIVAAASAEAVSSVSAVAEMDIALSEISPPEAEPVIPLGPSILIDSAAVILTLEALFSSMPSDDNFM